MASEFLPIHTIVIYYATQYSYSIRTRCLANLETLDAIHDPDLLTSKQPTWTFLPPFHLTLRFCLRVAEIRRFVVKPDINGILSESVGRLSNLQKSVVSIWGNPLPAYYVYPVNILTRTIYENMKELN